MTISIAVYASTYINQATGVGHDAIELGPGTFGGSLSSTYIFPGSLDIVKELNLGRTGAGTQQGVLTFQPGTNGGVNEWFHIDNAGGGFRISNSAWSQIFLIEKTGNVHLKTGSWLNASSILTNSIVLTDGDVWVEPGFGITLNNERRTAWPG
ncbi:MAG: hypothetical protein AABY22_33985, partial [Nanoarchaeota archaeon]